MKAYLYDKEFLKELDYHREKDSYARITLLTIDDYPKEYIEGTITGGSINIDGTSAVRRSCSLNLAVTNYELENQDSVINDKYWSYNNKFRLEIGIKNLINPNYPNMLWFDQGIYIVSSFSKSTSVNNINISIQGKDKMCRLNGEIGGNIPIETDFGTIETINKDGTSIIEKIPLKTIIQQAVKEYGNERLDNIIINDLDQIAYELWEYRGGTPMYLIVSKSSGTVLGVTFDGNTKISKIYDNQGNTLNISNLNFSNFEKNNYQYYSFNSLDKSYNLNATKIHFYNQECYLAKIEYGETAGYHQTALVYNSDLVLKAGETVTALLDKIKNMLGNYEYFYDLQGRFVFQKKKTYVQEIFSPINGELVTPTMQISPYTYEFKDYELFTAISSPPNIGNTKNDFTVWGVRKGASGADLPIHARYGIGKKPTTYTSLTQKDEYGRFKIYTTVGTDAVDWRELIYQMSKDYYKKNTEPNFLIELEEKNPWCKQGKTGYEHYYSDMKAFWRELYNPEDQNSYYPSGPNKYWNKNIHIDPTQLNFWFDFLDLEGDICNYNMEKIGVRSKVINENTIKSIFFKETPEILFVIPTKEIVDNNSSAYSVVQIQPNLEDLFARSAQGLSAIQRANDLIYQHTIGTETLSITSIPIYYLEPNTRIYVEGYGDYTLDKITYSLNYNGTMNISGVKINKDFY